MKKNIILFLVLSLLLTPLVVSALDLGSQTGVTDVTPSNLADKFQAFLNWFLIIAISIGVLMIIYGGILWMIAGGEPEKIKTARTALIYGLIGIGVAFLAFSADTLVRSFF